MATETIAETNANIIRQFAQRVGQDIKGLNQSVSILQQAIQTLPTTDAIKHAITQLKNELMGGEVDAQLDTIKELGERLKALTEDESISSVILQQFTKFSEKITTLETKQAVLDELIPENLVEIYNQAKQGE